jgi:hypothetical protein
MLEALAMTTRSAFLLASLLIFAPSRRAHAQRDQIKLENIRAQTDEIQEAVRRSHQRLAALGAQAMTSSSGLAKTTLDVSNETSAAYKLVSAHVVVDGQVQLDKKELTGAEKQLPVFMGATAPGEHTARVEVVLQGNGFGVFSYLRGFKITLSSSHTWTATTEPIHVTATLYELNDVTVPFQQRPQVRWAHGKNN